jgi:hypothetical protein
MSKVLGLMVCVLLSAAGCWSGPESSADTADQASSALDTSDIAASTCHSRPGETSVHVTLKVNEYRGLHHGQNGDHEIVEATITSTTSAANPTLVDTNNVEVAMNVKSSVDPNGLPHEVPMAVGDTFEVQGEYIPAATAHAHNANGAAAVIHFTHAPCGFAAIAGREYH